MSSSVRSSRSSRTRPIDEKPVASPLPCAHSRRSTSRCGSRGDRRQVADRRLSPCARSRSAIPGRPSALSASLEHACAVGRSGRRLGGPIPFSLPPTDCGADRLTGVTEKYRFSCERGGCAGSLPRDTLEGGLAGLGLAKALCHALHHVPADGRDIVEGDEKLLEPRTSCMSVSAVTVAERGPPYPAGTSPRRRLRVPAGTLRPAARASLGLSFDDDERLPTLARPDGSAPFPTGP